MIRLPFGNRSVRSFESATLTRLMYGIIRPPPCLPSTRPPLFSLNPSSFFSFLFTLLPSSSSIDYRLVSTPHWQFRLISQRKVKRASLSSRRVTMTSPLSTSLCLSWTAFAWWKRTGFGRRIMYPPTPFSLLSSLLLSFTSPSTSFSFSVHPLDSSHQLYSSISSPSFPFSHLTLSLVL